MIKIHKVLILFIIFVLSISLNVKAQWETLYWIVGPHLPSLYTVDFKDYKSGLAAGEDYNNNPIIIRTNDIGISWDTVFVSADTAFFCDITIIDSSTAIAVGTLYNGKGIIAKTNDFGNTWDTMMVNKALVAVHFPDNITGYAVGNYGTIFKTINSGQTWMPMTNLPVTQLNSVQFINDSTGFMCGDTNLYKTQNGGISWSITHFNNPVSSITFPSDSIGYCYGSYCLYKTTDCGVNWINYSSLLLSNFFQKLLFVNDTIGFVIGDFMVEKTIDGGLNWFSQSSSPPSNGQFMDVLKDICFVNIDTGFAVGWGQLYRTFNGGDTILASVPLYPSSNNTPLSVFPNPFKLSTNIQLQNTNANGIDYELEIIDIYGQKLKSIINITTDKIILNRENLPSGLYFVRLLYETKIIGSKKIIIVD